MYMYSMNFSSVSFLLHSPCRAAFGYSGTEHDFQFLRNLFRNCVTKNEQNNHTVLAVWTNPVNEIHNDKTKKSYKFCLSIKQEYQCKYK